MQKEIYSWDVLSHNTQPGHQQAFSNAKQTYLRCSPRANRNQVTSHQRKRSLGLVFKLPYMMRTQRVVMFGPGLCLGASDLPEELFWGTMSPFEVVGMFAGVDGYGSGVGLRLDNKIEVNMITMYPNTQHEREARADAPSKIVDSDGHVVPSVQALCSTIDAFIYVVDAQSDLSFRPEAQAEMWGMLDSRWTRHDAPLLVLSCQSSRSAPAANSCLEVAQKLQISGLARPWQVRTVSLTEFNAPVVQGMSWLHETLN